MFIVKNVRSSVNARAAILAGNPFASIEAIEAAVLEAAQDFERDVIYDVVEEWFDPRDGEGYTYVARADVRCEFDPLRG